MQWHRRSRSVALEWRDGRGDAGQTDLSLRNKALDWPMIFPCCDIGNRVVSAAVRATKSSASNEALENSHQVTIRPSVRDSSVGGDGFIRDEVEVAPTARRDGAGGRGTGPSLALKGEN